MAVHQVEYYWNLLKPLGLSGGASSPTLLVSADESRQLDIRLASAGVDSSDIVIGINPGSTYGSAKRWLPERFAEVAQRLAERLGAGRECTGGRGHSGGKGRGVLGKGHRRSNRWAIGGAVRCHDHS